jgi:hypothetical protein
MDPIFSSLLDVLKTTGPVALILGYAWWGERTERQQAQKDLLDVTRESIRVSDQWLRVLDRAGIKPTQ